MKKLIKVLSVCLCAFFCVILFSGCKTKPDPKFYDMTGIERLEDMAEIRIDTNDQSISGLDDYTACTVTVGNCANEHVKTNVEAGIRLRGNSTRNVPKKAYRIKFNSKQNMLGLNNGNKMKSWVLLADFYDPSMLRNSTALYIAKGLLENNWYSSDFKYVEVYINSQYQGVYLLAEQQQINKNRININEVEENYTGTDIGYLLECIGADIGLNKYQLELVDRRGDKQISSQRTYEIKNDYYSQDQVDFIYNYINDVFYIIYQAIYNNQFYTLDSNYNVVSANFSNAYECISQVFDVEAAVNMYIMSETVMNMDVCNSFYIFADMSANGNKKLTIAAPWDFDFAFGNAEGFSECMKTDDWFSSNLLHCVDEMTNPWYVLLAKADWFNELAKERWNEVYESVMLKSLEHIKQVTFSYEEEFKNNYKKWGNIGKSYMWFQSRSTNRSFKKQADAAQWVYHFLEKRIEWINSQWGNNS